MIIVQGWVQKFLAWPTFEGDRTKTTLLFFSTVSLHFNTYWYWYINLTIYGAIHPSQHFPLGAAFVSQAGNFWTHPRMLKTVLDSYDKIFFSWKIRGQSMVTEGFGILSGGVCFKNESGVRTSRRHKIHMTVVRGQSHLVSNDTHCFQACLLIHI
jgi:hypothetical protein